MTEKELRECQQCGKERPPQNSQFCSKACRRKALWRDVTCAQCGVGFSARKIWVDLGRMKHCSIKCRSLAARIHSTVEHKGQTYHISNGYYVCVKNGKRLHRVIWEEVNGLIPNGYVVHHKDGNKINNDITNLEIMEWGAHTALHHTGKKRVSLTPKRLCFCGDFARALGLCSKHYQREKVKSHKVIHQNKG